jgi:hypothetical protein
MQCTARQEEVLMDEQRERRVLVQCPISFMGNHGVSSGTIFNLSKKGCAIESATSVQIGATITLRLYIPALPQPIEVDEAEVTWSAGQDFGVQFRRLKPPAQERLHGHIANLCKESK